MIKGVWDMKELYEKPIIEITEFEVEDIITASGLTPVDGGSGDSMDWGDLF